MKPFSRHSKQWYAPRPSWGKQATINGRPAWQVAEERKRERDQSGADSWGLSTGSGFSKSLREQISSMISGKRAR